MAGDDNSAVTPPPSTATPPPPLHENTKLLNFIHSVILKNQDSQVPFYVLDMASLTALMDRWIYNMPTVRPFYAVKCFPEPSLLAKFAELDAGFDCASRAEIEAVLSLGVPPERIIYANPCKPTAHIRYAAEVGVNLTTFDSESEIQKIRKLHPNCELVIRIKAPEDGEAIYPLGKKFGVLPEEVERLLRSACAARLPVIGVSFHIGSGAKRLTAFRTAIEASRKVFDEATRIGMPKMRLLNVGGGFADNGLFESAAETINSAINEFFGDRPDLTVIAEPGRFFAGPIFTLAATVIGKRVRGDRRDYFISDGVYGTIKFDDGKVDPIPFAFASNPGNPLCRGERRFMSTVFGPTCAAVDTVVMDLELPELEINDWLLFPKMGSYSWALGSNFNGFNNDSILTYAV